MDLASLVNKKTWKPQFEIGISHSPHCSPPSISLMPQHHRATLSSSQSCSQPSHPLVATQESIDVGCLPSVWLLGVGEFKEKVEDRKFENLLGFFFWKLRFISYLYILISIYPLTFENYTKYLPVILLRKKKVPPSIFKSHFLTFLSMWQTHIHWEC